MYGPYKTAMKDLPGYLPGTVYGFLDKTADLNHPQLDIVLESYLDGKVGLIAYSNSDHTPLRAQLIQAALFVNAPEADWSVKDKNFLSKVDGKLKYMGNLSADERSLTIGTAEYLDAVIAAQDARTTTPTAPQTVAAPTPVESSSTNVVSVITSNRWSGDALIVSGTLTNTSTVVVLITGIVAKGFDQDQKMVIEGSDFTIVRNDLAPGEVVNFNVALKDDRKQLKFVKVLPSWSPSELVLQHTSFRPQTRGMSRRSWAGSIPAASFFWRHVDGLNHYRRHTVLFRELIGDGKFDSQRLSWSLQVDINMKMDGDLTCLS